MTVLRLTEEHQQQYSDFVAANSSGSFLQSWAWGEFQTEHGKTAIRYGVFDSDDNAPASLIATVQLFHTKVPKLPGSYLYAPYGPLVAAELLNSGEESVREIIAALLGKIKTDFAKAWFIRFEPKDELPIDGKPSVHIQPGSTLITDLSISEEDLLAGMHPKTRYNIKVAAKHNIMVKQNLTNADAIALLTGTSKRQGYKSHPAAYYEQLLSYFSNNANADCKLQLYEAFDGEVCIASAIMVDHGTTRTYLFGGSDNSKRNLMAPYALHWQAISDAKANGQTTYDWWGAETATGATPGFVQFKLRWGGTQQFYAGARDIVMNSRWYFAYTALRKVNRLI
jgi:peptidoglycan pentaglycine glycine transferase (the first glycine)